MEQFGALLKARRSELGLTQASVAIAAGVAVTYYSDLERSYAKPGKAPVRPSDENIKALASALKTPEASLHSAMGRMELPAEKIERITAEHEELEELEETGQYIAQYRDLSPRNRRIVNQLIKQLDEEGD